MCVWCVCVTCECARVYACSVCLYETPLYTHIYVLLAYICKRYFSSFFLQQKMLFSFLQKYLLSGSFYLLYLLFLCETQVCLSKWNYLFLHSLFHLTSLCICCLIHQLIWSHWLGSFIWCFRTFFFQVLGGCIQIFMWKFGISVGVW